MSTRKAIALVQNLPRESSTFRRLHGDDAQWGDTEHLLAVAVDALNIANWQRGGGKSANRPKPIPRPGEAQKNRTRLAPAEIERRLLAQMERRGHGD